MTEPLHILILEDNRTDAELTLFELEDAGFRVAAKVVENEQDYIYELQQSCYDLILSDYDLPQYNGALALLEANKQCPDTPFILVTGAVSEDRAIEILTQGAKDYVLKNRLQQRLVPAVRRALAEADELKARKKAEEELREAHRDLERQVAARTAELQKELEHRRQIEAILLKYNERLEILSYTAGRLLASDKPQQLVVELCTRVMEFLDCQAFFNFLVDEDAGRLHLNAYAGIPPEAAREMEWLEYGVAVCGCVARDKCRIVAENIPTTPDVRTELVKSFGIKAYACHPLMEQNRVIGTLSFGTRNRTTFSADDLALMKAVADQVAIAMNRVKIEEALRASELRERIRAGEMQTVMDVAPVAIWIAHDPQCLRITGNRYADEIMQVPPDANVSMSAPGDAAVTYKVLRNGAEMKPDQLPAQVAAATGRPVEAEMLDLVFSDGRVVRLIEGAMPFFDAEGRVRGSVAAGTDITRRRMLEEELKETTERFEMAQHAAQVGTWDWNVLTGDILWSDQMFYLFKLDPRKNRASFELWESILHPEDVPIAQGRINDALRQKTTLNSDYRIVLPDGQVRWINSIGEGRYDDTGKPVRMIGICMDITDRKQTEEALGNNENLYRGLFNSMQEGFYIGEIIYDEDGSPQDYTYLDINPVFEKIMGISRDQIIGRRMKELNPHVSSHWLSIFKKVAITGMSEYSEFYSKSFRRHFKAMAYRPMEKRFAVLVEDITERKQGEEALKISEEKYRNLVKYAPAAIYEMDLPGAKFLSVNDVMCNILGYSREELLAVKPLDILAEESRPLFEERTRQKLAGKAVAETVEYRIRKKNGDWIYAAVNMGTVSYPGEKSARVAVIAHDITARKKIEEALRDSEQRLKFHFENSPLAVVEWDADFIVTEWSSEAERIFGWKKEEVIGRRIDHLRIIYNEDIPAVDRIMETLATGEKHTVVSTNRNYTKSGAIIECTWHNSAIFNAEGKMESVLSLVEDVTERKRTDQAILLAKEEWERTFDTVPDLIAILDNQHKIIRVNKAMADRLGVAPKRCIGLTCHETVHGAGEPPAFCPHQLTCGDGLQHVAEVHEPNLGGDFLVSTTPLCDQEGRPVGSVHVARDITARKRAEDLLARQAAELQERTNQLEAANRELESFSYSVSHDLRAPLRAIDGFSRIILRQQGEQFDENTRRQFDMIRDNTRKMGALIDSLLSFSRVQKTSMNISVIDMDKLAREVWEEIRIANKERNLEFRITEVLPGCGDRTLIRQVLFNLLENAVKFTRNRRSGIIEMSSAEESGRMVYCVKDNGAGFDMEYYNKLFGVFQRLHTAEEYAGTGVGLAIVQRIVKRHGGRVWAEGKVNEGAAFYFALPQKC